MPYDAEPSLKGLSTISLNRASCYKTRYMDKLSEIETVSQRALTDISFTFLIGDIS